MEVRPERWNKTQFFFQTAAVSILLYGCTMRTLTKRMEETATVCPPTPITKSIQVRRTRHAENCWRSKGELVSDILPLFSSNDRAKLKPIYSNSVSIQDVTWKICRERWTIETGGEKWSGKSVQAVWHGNDDIPKFKPFLKSANIRVDG